MIPTDLEQRERLIRFVQTELIASWYVCDRADALSKCPSDIHRDKFRDMAIRVVDLVEGYSEEMPEPTPGKERRRTKYGSDDELPESWKNPEKKSEDRREDEEGGLFNEE